MNLELVATLGSRTGALLALVIFGLAFTVLGAFVRRTCLRHQWGRWAATSVGALLAAGLLALVYGSSLDGFYELRANATSLEARYLLIPWPSRMAWSDLSRVEARVAFKGRWRLELAGRSGNRLVSATSSRRDVESAADSIRRRLRERPR